MATLANSPSSPIIKAAIELADKHAIARLRAATEGKSIREKVTIPVNTARIVLAALEDRAGLIGVTVDDLALDEMDGNQNAEPRWSANRLEEVLREGLPDQNAEPVEGSSW